VDVCELKPQTAVNKFGNAEIGVKDPLELGKGAERLKEISLDLVQKGDVLKVLPGARIPTDGTIIAGSTYIDESMITGESVPVFRGKGDIVFGSTVNQISPIYICATAIGSEGALAQIVRMVEAAQMNKAPVQAYGKYMTNSPECCFLIF
jgi:P-type Cu+ transporter